MRGPDHTDHWSALPSCNPVVKLLAPVPAMIVALAADDVRAPLLLGGTALLLLVVAGRLPARTLAAVVAGTAATVGVLTLSLGAWSGGLGAGGTTAVRLSALTLLALVAALTTDGADLVRSLVAQLRVPYRLGYAGLAALRFVPRLQHDLDLIRAAHRVRGVAGGRGPVARARRGTAYVVPLLAGALRHGDRVALAMEARGFGAHPTRTERHVPPLRRRDAVLTAVLLGAAVLALVL